MYTRMAHSIGDNSKMNSISPRKTTNAKNMPIFLFISIFSAYVTVLCIIETDYPSGYEMLFLLPLSFFISIPLVWILINREEMFSNLPIVIVLLLLFVRNVLTPYTMITGSYISSLGIASRSNAIVSILLVTYETIAIFLFLYTVEHFRFKQKGIQLTSGKPNSTVFYAILIAMFIIAIAGLVLAPAIRSNYVSIFKSGFMAMMTEDYSYRGNAISRALGTAAEMTIETLRYLFPCLIIYKLAQKGDTLRIVIISVAIVALQLFFITDSNAYILMLMISQMIFIVKLHPKYRKWMTYLLGIGIIAMAFLMYFNRFSLGRYSNSLSLFLQSYVPGIANTAGVLNINPKHNPLQLFSDIWVAIPFKEFLGYSGDVQSLATIWKQTNNSYRQIMSTIGQSYYYFGFLLSPILSFALINISRKCNKKYMELDNAMLCAAYIYLILYSAATPFVYNFCIYLKAFLQRTIFIFILAYFSPFAISSIPHLSKEYYE